MQHSRLVVAYTCGNRPEADLAKNELESEGIHAMVQADTVGGMREHLAWTGDGFKVLVREEDAATARELLTPSADTLLAEDNGSPDGSLPSWRRFT